MTTAQHLINCTILHVSSVNFSLTVNVDVNIQEMKPIVMRTELCRRQRSRTAATVCMGCNGTTTGGMCGAPSDQHCCYSCSRSSSSVPDVYCVGAALRFAALVVITSRSDSGSFCPPDVASVEPVEMEAVNHFQLTGCHCCTPPASTLTL